MDGLLRQGDQQEHFRAGEAPENIVVATVRWRECTERGASAMIQATPSVQRAVLKKLL